MISSMISWGNSMVMMAEEYRVSVNQGTSGVSDAGRSRGDSVRGLDGYRWELAVKARSFALTAFEVRLRCTVYLGNGPYQQSWPKRGLRSS